MRPPVLRQRLLALYDRLLQLYGQQQWWPADSVFEVMVGAILTQNTAWSNVEKALASLNKAGCLHEDALFSLTEEALAALIRPSGYFNVKARRLKNFIYAYKAAGGFDSLVTKKTAPLRHFFLSINGIGPETADDIVLYAFERPVFVIDVYTRRLLARLGLIAGGEQYDLLQSQIEQALQGSTALYNEYHALIVRHAKERCTEEKTCCHCWIERSFND